MELSREIGKISNPETHSPPHTIIPILPVIFRKIHIFPSGMVPCKIPWYHLRRLWLASDLWNSAIFPKQMPSWRIC